MARKRHTAQQLLHGKGSVARPAEAIRERDNKLKQRYMTTIFDDMDKGYIAAVTNQDAKNLVSASSSPNQQAKIRQDKTSDKCSLKIQRGFFERCAANGTGSFVQSTWTSFTVSSVQGCNNSRHRGYVHASWNQRRRPRCSPFFCGAEMRSGGHPNTNNSFLEQLVLPPAQFLFCKSAPRITDNSIQKYSTQS